jgi:hypothetical protein
MCPRSNDFSEYNVYHSITLFYTFLFVHKCSTSFIFSIFYLQSVTRHKYASILCLFVLFCFKTGPHAGHWFLMPVILATQEADIRRIKVQSQPQSNSWGDPILKNPSQKRASRVPQVARAPSLASMRPWVQTQCCQKKKKNGLTTVVRDLLLKPAEYWNYRYEWPHLAEGSFFFFLSYFYQAPGNP